MRFDYVTESGHTITQDTRDTLMRGNCTMYLYHGAFYQFVIYGNFPWPSYCVWIVPGTIEWDLIT